jgi:hopanoid biosynthesis associated protein HpnK
MVSGQAFEHAVALAKENPGLAVGLHVTCVDGQAVLSPSEIPHVADKNGNFPIDPAAAGLRYFFCRSARRELFNEIGSQFEKFSRSGLRFSHVDSHCHLHVHPVILDAIIKFCGKYRVKRLRVPADSFFTALPFLPSPFSSAGYALIFKLLTRSMKRRLRRRGFIFPNRVYGNFLTGKMSPECVTTVLKDLPRGISEIYFHPALPSPSIPGEKANMLGGPAEARQRFKELSILIDPDLRSKIDQLGIVLSTYFDLEKDL